MLRPAYLLGVLVLLAAGAGVAVQGDPPPAPVAVAAPVPVSTTSAPAQVTPSPAPRSTGTVGSDWVDNESTLTNNALYRAGKVPASGCRPPAARFRSSTAVAGYARALVACLNRSWSALLTRSGFYFLPPDFTVYKGRTSSACGDSDGDAVAFYCSTDHKIYLDWSEYVSKRRDEQVWIQGALMGVVSHEYGHHVQELVGIGAFYDDRAENATGEAELETTRRMELQASCFGAAFLGGSRQALGLTGERLFALQDDLSTGDEIGGLRDHGSADSNERWTSAAFASASPGSCNTWKAADDQVY